MMLISLIPLVGIGGVFAVMRGTWQHTRYVGRHRKPERATRRSDREVRRATERGRENKRAFAEMSAPTDEIPVIGRPPAGFGRYTDLSPTHLANSAARAQRLNRPPLPWAPESDDEWVSGLVGAKR